MAKVLVHPEIVESSKATGRWMVVIFNNELNTFDEVIEVLMRATGCSATEAYIEAWEAHTYGRCSVHFSARTECEVVAAMISSVGVQTVVSPEWAD